LAISDAFNMPNVLPADNIIPEDWGDDDLMSDFMSEPVSTIARQPKPQPEVIVAQPQVIEPTIAIAKPIKVQQPVQEPIAPVTTKANTVSNAAANSALVRAMGLEGLSPEEIEKVAETVGELMPVIVDGMMKLLRSRASIKNEFRMNMTTIQPVENNPLKFSVNPKDALENMFVRKNSAYKGAVESFTEGFDGIVDHQIAIIAGMRSAFKGMMDRFDPEKLEKQFDKQSKGVTLPGMQKVKYWNSYAEHFASYAENMEQSFRHLFGDDFVQAYENQIFKLVSARRKAARNDQ
jgi:type VI secretion system protein